MKEDQGFSAAWDVGAGDFLRDGAHRILPASDREAYQSWCYKMIRTERFGCAAYPGYLGVELDKALQVHSNRAAEAALERTITEALMVHPRTEYVRGFSFEWEGDRVAVSFTVKGRLWEEFSMRISVNPKPGKEEANGI